MVNITRRAALACALAIPGTARAQSAWPSGTITLVAPAPAGGSVDVIARLVQPGLQRRLGATVIVENKSGAATSLGANYVAKAPRDGSKWLINADPQVLNPALMSNMPFDSEKDLDPVLMLGTSPNVLAAHPASAYRTLDDVLADARKSEGVNFAVIGDTLELVSMVLLNKLAGAHLTPIAYRGGAPAVNDTLGGHIRLIAGSASLLAPFFGDGQLRAIAQTGLQRHAALANVPTVAESGFPDFSAVSFWGFYAPSGTAVETVNRFVTELTAVLQEGDIKDRLGKGLLMDVKVDGPGVFQTFFQEQLHKWGQVIRENGLKSSS
jgi:tripartite-type tricarboxylate transporter receptor subunit TctC